MNGSILAGSGFARLLVHHKLMQPLYRSAALGVSGSGHMGEKLPQNLLVL
jgi:hypothetical protein